MFVLRLKKKLPIDWLNKLDTQIVSKISAELLPKIFA